MSQSADHKRSSFAKLALFFGFGSSSPSPGPAPPTVPRSFSAHRAVGLGIVAAMSAEPVIAHSRPKPVAVGAPRAADAKPEKRRSPPAEEMEQSESYTCVISYLGGRPARKRVYLGDGDGGIMGELRVDKVVPFELPSPPPAETPSQYSQLAAEFLRCCFRCKKQLDGLDIYIYRGDKSFCSEDCRCQQIVLDELSKKFKMGTKPNHESSMSPCSASSPVAAEVAMS